MKDSNQNANLSDKTRRAVSVLNYWHKIEFFESTDLKELEEDAAGVISLTLEQLQNPGCLPWINAQQNRLAGENFSPEKKYRYKLYFGNFERQEIFTIASRHFPDIAGHNDERNQDEGRTCSITLNVDQNGCADVGSFSFSTVTWALGQLKKGNFDNIGLKAYEADTEKLRQRFSDIITVAANIKNEHALPPMLTTYELIEFLKSMEKWTDFTPSFPAPALYIRLTEARPQKGKKPAAADLTDLTQLAPLTILSDNLSGKIPERVSHKAGTAVNSGEITILNSFYLRDLEKIIARLEAEGLNPASPLGCYLTGSRHRKPDLLQPEGRDILLEMLRLDNLPEGRWPASPAHAMSLMQQFAINTIDQQLATCGLYSVNGPPGTGKTTLLRDLIASNLVKRAHILAGLETASDAFSGELTITAGGSQKTIKKLSDSLAGFEMVVVSSNNAAVENISRELPQTKSLGRDWQGINYLKPVAQKLAALHVLPEGQSQYEITPLETSADCWGLIAAALGKHKNREIFGTRVIYQTIEKCLASPPADAYSTLTAAVRKLSGLPGSSFAQARSDFKKAEQTLQTLLDELKRLEALPALEQHYQQQGMKVKNKLARSLSLRARITKLEHHKPAWWSPDLKRGFRARGIIKGLSRRRSMTQAQYEAENHKLMMLETTLENEQKICHSLQEKYSDVTFANCHTDLESPDSQRTAFGQCQRVNEARSQLTVKALELHQAWLGEAYKEAKLSDSLFVLMSAIDGKQTDADACKALWRLFFMIVPVVSSTFASVARQFKAFDEQEIGWLFIDEAGQATPQQAAGALWRAKRAVVVGDPLQIEPVFTVPPAFVEAIARREFGEQWKEWAPTETSVQNLADRVNPYGTRQIADSWLGSPLRVHRRCDEPMFTIANRIAYNNKMLHGQDCPWDNTPTLWGPSCWFDVRGSTAGKHFVPAQAQHVLSMLQEYIDHYQTLPDVYLISPFKQVKKELRRFLSSELPEVKGKAEWLKERIGTVHTFQGKEEKIVIFVLGIADENPAAAQWASAKPNLLNVAVTRAQKQVYIVGSKAVWAGCKYFSEANELLT